MDSVIRTHCVDDITRLCGVARERAESVDFLAGPVTPWTRRRSAGACRTAGVLRLIIH